MPRKRSPGLPSRKQILDFIATSDQPAGKREIEKQDKSDTFYTYERSYGTFQRVFALPDGLDTEHSVAELKDGVLTVVMPKKPGASSKTIAVKTSETPKS